MSKVKQQIYFARSRNNIILNTMTQCCSCIWQVAKILTQMFSDDAFLTKISNLVVQYQLVVTTWLSLDKDGLHLIQKPPLTTCRTEDV